ncbi:MAG: hypothetical protein R2865_13190 [Deinococcales bacterium]
MELMGWGRERIILLRRSLGARQIFQTPGRLAKRFGRDNLLFQELLKRADTLIISYPEADQGGPLKTEHALIQNSVNPLPLIPAGSPSELMGGSSYEADFAALDYKSIHIAKLMRFDECAFRYWAENTIPNEEEQLWHWQFIDRLRDYGHLSQARLELLKSDFPQAAMWLHEYSQLLQSLQFGVFLPEKGALRAKIDAANRSGSRASLYTFCAPEQIQDSEAAQDYLGRRWSELWAVGHLLENYQGRIREVDLWVWPILAAPLKAYEGIDYVWRRIKTRQADAQDSFERFSRGYSEAQPGFHCRSCRVFDVCRKGER